MPENDTQTVIATINKYPWLYRNSEQMMTVDEMRDFVTENASYFDSLLPVDMDNVDWEAVVEARHGKRI